MKKSPHTQGPWSYHIGGDYVQIESADGRLVCQWNRVEDEEARERADAALISSAPDLVAALQAAVDDINAGALEVSDFPWMSAAVLALSKAKGN